MYVPVKSISDKQLMPTTPPVARHLIKSGKATPYWSNGIFSIRLNYDTTDYTQDIVVGVIPLTPDLTSGAVAFDTDLLRYSVGWIDGLIDFAAYNGWHQSFPSIEGKLLWENRVGPGWAKNGSFEDTRAVPLVVPYPRIGRIGKDCIFTVIGLFCRTQ